MKWAKRRRVVGAVAFAGALAFGGVLPAQGASQVYKTTTSPMAALTAYYSSVAAHTQNAIHSCQNPTFAAAIYLTTSGGTQIRRVDGNCSLYTFTHAPESSTRAWCANKESTSKYAACTRWY